MSLIDDWLRQHPNLTLTRDQRETLEELIRDDYAPPDDPFDMNADLRDDAETAFKEGATAMRKSIAAEFSALDGIGSGVGDVIAGLAGFVEKMKLPEMPEED